MATTNNSIQYDLRFFDEFYPLLNGFGKKAKLHLRKATELGLFSKDSFMEQVFSDISGIERNNVNGMDFVDGSDLKTVVSQFFEGRAGCYLHRFRVARINSKIGSLRVIGFNKITDTFCYFHIPREAYIGLKSLNIEVERNNTGYTSFTGVYQDRQRGDQDLKKWWQYQVPTIYDLI